ncbi:ras association domain-containing protein 8 [Sardina pilchardus]|uniref:ras association domain-containing protein 8 n=1 Tax=Sardina pilchardus TaxID=27697 RepID=UPI002E0D47D2
MELKVWVDGVVRVVCGLSQETSCQDVVIALAQAIGQTGRYVLVQKLRDTERQLLANERPLESLAKLGQHGSEVQFFLRRTGPSSSDSLGSDRSLTLPKPPPSSSSNSDGDLPKRREPKKSLTFNLGPSSSPRAKPKQARKSLPARDSPEQRASPSPVSHTPSPTPQPPSPAGPPKEEVFRHVLQQQERLAALEAQLEALERESRPWEQPSPSTSTSTSLSPCPSPSGSGSGEPPGLQGELERLEETLRRNQAELAHEDYWEEELRVELEHERNMRRRLGELHAKLDDCGRRLQDFNERADYLERELQKESQAAANASSNASASASSSSSPEESLAVMRAEIQSRQRQGTELEAELSQTESTLGKTESLLQERQDELEELNKELRQCNLQQFIQQAGVLPVHSSSQTDLNEPMVMEQHIELAQLLKERYGMSSPVSPPMESPPRPTAKHFLGHPRNLQNPLVSSLNPEVLTSRESSWR